MKEEKAKSKRWQTRYFALGSETWVLAYYCRWCLRQTGRLSPKALFLLGERGDSTSVKTIATSDALGEALVAAVATGIRIRLKRRDADLEQEALAIVLRALQDGKTSEPLRYAYGVCNNLVRQYLSAKTRNRFVPLESASEIPSTEPPAATPVERSEFFSEFEHAIASLPEEAQEILALYLSGQSRREIAEQFYLSPRAISHRIATIRAHLEPIAAKNGFAFPSSAST